MLLPPLRITVKETELVLCGPVRGHLVPILAALLGKGTNALVHPFIAVHLGPSLAGARELGRSRGLRWRWRCVGHNVVDS